MADSQKVTTDHLRRKAFLYVRQSSLCQVMENTESTQRQYGLRQRAVALGWPADNVIVIDNDLGQSGASADGREGFQRLVAEVGLGNAGLVMGLEVSRLARNSTDWHRLLEISALTDTLILDEDGLYDPRQFNDRLLLGLKGTMSEAELHLLRARLRGGILSKARRGELKSPLPVGLAYSETGEVILDPDRQVQEAIHHLFSTFERTGTAWGALQAFRREGLLFPQRLRKGPRKGELHWAPPGYTRILQVLHNPRYAGTFFYGRTRTRKGPNGKARTKLLPQDQWHTLLPESHARYITWQQYEANQQRLRQGAQAHGADRRHGPPREGPALLQGLVVCGKCGQRMSVRYHHRFGQLTPEYDCQRHSIEQGTPPCQVVMGKDLDQAIGNLLVGAVTPLALEVALTVQQELQSRMDEADRLRRKQVDRARYEAELARRRFMQVDPDNRLVADTLEADWNEKLRALNAAQEEYERNRERDRSSLTESQRQQILALAGDFPRLWCDPQTPQRERKRMVRLLLDDVTLFKDREITAHVRFRGGATQALTLPLPSPSYQLWQTSPEVIAEMDCLLDNHTPGQIAQVFNDRGLRTGKGLSFTAKHVARLARAHGLKSRYERLREKGLLTLNEMAHKLGVYEGTVRIWRKQGLLAAQTYDDKNEPLYEPPGPNPPAKMQGLKLSERRPPSQVTHDRTEEVQYEA